MLTSDNIVGVVKAPNIPLSNGREGHWDLEEIERGFLKCMLLGFLMCEVVEDDELEL